MSNSYTINPQTGVLDVVRSNNDLDLIYVNISGDTMTGGLTIQPATDTLTALVVNDKDGNNVLTVDTINNKMLLVGARSGMSLELQSTLNMVESGVTYYSGFYNNVNGEPIFTMVRSTVATAFSAGVDGDTFRRIVMDTGGKIQWGSGAGTWDTNLYRDSASVLKTDDALVVAGTGDSSFAGELGIGITAPTSKLHVYNASYTATPMAYFQGSNPGVMYSVERASGGVAFDLFSLYAKNTTSGNSILWGNVGGFGPLNEVTPSLTYMYFGADTDASYTKNTLRLYPGQIANFQGKVGIGTATPTNNLSFIGTASKTFGVDRHTTANTAGSLFTINAGGATLGATDKNGGNLVLSGGMSTGTGSSGVMFYGYPAATTGSVRVISATPTVAGSGYTAGDTLTITTGSGDATITVSTVDGSGAITAFVTTPVSGGASGYSVATGQATSGGTGTLATVNVTGITSTVDGTATALGGFLGNGNFGIGTTAPARKFHVTTSLANYPSLLIAQFANSNTTNGNVKVSITGYSAETSLAYGVQNRTGASLILQNVDTTAGNYSAFGFLNGTANTIAGVFGICDIQGSTPTGHMSFSVNNAGTFGTAFDIKATEGILYSAVGAILTLTRVDTTITANDMVGKIQFYAGDSQSTTNKIVADIEAQATNTIATDINPGRLIFRTTGTGVAATPTERLRIDEAGDFTIWDTGDFIFGTTTGTKIGTVGGASGEKIAFWGSTPIVQPVLATGAGRTVDEVITVLQNLGLVRQS
jgi:hypothetical protein